MSHMTNSQKTWGERPSANHTVERIDVNGNYCPSNCKWLEKDCRTETRGCQYIWSTMVSTSC